ncbi:hypothetical protein ACFL5Z_12270 [Planctomycetota bacterium]
MMGLRKFIVLFLLCVVLGMGDLCYGMANERIGPDTNFPTVAQQDWPRGIVGIPRHSSRVYSIWVNGNETFYFKSTVEEINEILGLFATARMRDHIVRIQAGEGKASTFSKEQIEYNISLQIVGGHALFFTREERREDMPLEPVLSIRTGDDASFLNQLKWPKNVIVESEISGISINSDKTKPKRNFYYGRLEFEDGSPPVGFVKRVNSRITLWEQKETDGIGIGSVNNKGYFTILLSEKELADLKKGTTWLTITIGNYLIKAGKNDKCFPIERLTKDKEQARPVQVGAPTYYHGRILFEDDSCPILYPPPWPGAEISVSFPYAGPATIEPDGYFKVSMTKEQYEQLKARKAQRNIYIPDLVKRGRSTAKYIYPANLLSQDVTKAGVVRIPRPKAPRKALTKAESKIGKPIPGFDKIRFERFQKDRIKGKPLLICFWDMDQRPSRQCIRELEKQRLTLQDKDIVVLAVHSGSKKEKEVRQWFAKQNFSLVVGTIEGDPHDILLAWGARGTPWLVLTDEKHIITKAGFNLDVLK